MTYYDRYKARLDAEGSNERQAYINVSTDVIASSFKNSPHYTQVIVDGVLMDAIKQLDKDSKVKNLVFLPSTTVSIGGTVTISSETWLIMDFDANPLYPKAKINRCNQSVKWVNGATTLEYPCVMTSEILDSDSNAKMNLPKSEFLVYLKYNGDTVVLKEGKRLVLGDRAYEVIAYDNITHVVDSTGVLTLRVKTDLTRDTDDLDERVAENPSSTSGGWSRW
jgi:hypothetical protein